jgi:hypothetical protein
MRGCRVGGRLWRKGMTPANIAGLLNFALPFLGNCHDRNRKASTKEEQTKL